MTCFVFTIFFFVQIVCKAQVYDFKTINQEQGLPSSVITSIAQDSRDLLWIGTDGAGLVKYDGNSYVVYDQSNGLKGTFITDIVEDANANMVISSKYGGISVFNGKNFFKNYNAGINGIKSNFFYKLIKSNKGVFCVGEKEIILIKEDYSIQRIFSNENNYAEVNSLVVDSLANLYLGTSSGLLCLKGKALQLVKPDVLNGYISIFSRKESEIIISSMQEGLFELHKSLSLTKIASIPKFFQSKHLFVSKRGTIWLSGEGKQGLLMFDGEGFSEFNASNGFNGENVLCFFQDKSKNLLIGTEGSGLYKTGPQLFIDFANVNELSNPMIFSIFKDNEDLYVGVRKQGVYKFKEDNKGKIRFEKAFLNNTGANILYKNNSNELLLGNKEGLSKIENNKITRVKFGNSVKEEIPVVCLKQDNLNRYVIGSFGQGLLITDEKFNKIISFKANKKTFADHIYTIEQFKKNKWYVGTSNGLYILTESSPNVFEISEQIVSGVISVSTKDMYGNFWFAGQGGIYCFTKSNVKQYGRKDGLTSTLIYTLIADKKGFVWCGSNLGMDRIEPNRYGEIISIKNFNSKNGFKGLETNMRSQFRDNDGNLYIGTAKGLTKCLVNYKIKTDSIPKAIITNISVANQENNLSNENGKNKWLTIPDSAHEYKTNENQLTFRFNIANTGNDRNFFYTYRLDGAGENWSNPTELGEVTYSNLSPGKYIFRVKAVNRYGQNLNQEAQFYFSIKTPFYLTWWFISSLLALLGVVVYALYRQYNFYRKDAIADYEELESNVKETRLYFLILGFVFPGTEIFMEIFKVRNESELLSNVVIGVVFLILYFLSKKNRFFQVNIDIIFNSVFLVFAFFTIYKCIFLSFELITFSEFLIVIFFSYGVFRNLKYFLIFNISCFLFFGIFLFVNIIEFKLVLTYLNSILILTILSYIRHLAISVAKEKLLFANSVVNDGNSIVIASNNEGKVVFVSDNVREILGYTSDELMGEGWWNLSYVEKSLVLEVKKKVVSSLFSEQTYKRKVKKKDGTYIWVQWQDKPFNKNTFVGIGQDITQLVNIQAKYETIIETAQDIVYKTDSKGIYTYINDYTEKILGYKVSELIGKHFTLLIQKDYVRKVAHFYLKNSNTLTNFDTLEFPVQTKSGEIKWLSQNITAERGKDNELIGFSGIVRDITAIKKAEIEKVTKQNKVARYNSIFKELTLKSNSETIGLSRVLDNIVKNAAIGLNIDRISIWEYVNDEILCTKVYTVKDEIFDQGDILKGKDYPNYFKALLSGRPIIINNICESEITNDFCIMPDNDIKSLLDVPVFLNGELNGLVCCEMTESYKQWDDEDVSFVRSIADIIAISVEAQKRKNLEKKLLFRSKVLAAIAKTTEKLLVSDNIQETLKQSIQSIGEATNIDKIYFYEYNREIGVLKLSCDWYSKNFVKMPSENSLQQMPINALGPISNYLLENKNYFAITREIGNQSLKQMFDELGILSTLILPVYVRGEFHGFIGFDDCKFERVWSEDQLNVIQSLVTNISNALERINANSVIKTSERNFRLINETIPDDFWLYDIKSKKYLYQSEKCIDLYELSPKSFYNGTYSSEIIVHEEDKVVYNDAPKLLEKQDSYLIEYRIILKGNKIKWIQEKSSGIKNEVGELIYISGVSSDITARKNTELALKESENNFRLLNETIDNVFWLYDLIGKKVIYISSSCEKILGVKAEAFYSTNNYWVNYIFEDDKSLILKAHEEIERVGFYEIEYRIKTKEGSFKWIYEKSFGIKGAEGRYAKSSGICTDITEKKETELALKESETNFRQINETIQDVFWLYDLVNRKYLYISPNSLQILGIPENEFYQGIHIKRDFVFDEDKSIYNSAESLLIKQDSYEIEYRIKLDDGSFKWINEKSYAIRNDRGELIRNSGICSDITGKKKTEAEIRQLSLVAEKTRNGILIADKDGRAVWANQGYLNMFEIAEADLIGRWPRELFKPNDNAFDKEMNVLNGNAFSLEIEARTFLKKKLWVELSSTPILDKVGEVVQQIEVLTDITDKKLAEANIKQLSLVAEKTNNGVLITDVEGKAIWANQSYLEMFEVSLNDLIGVRPRQLFNPNEELFFNENDGINRVNCTREFEIQTYKNKVKKWVELNNTVINDDNGNAFQQIEVITDITEKVKTRNEIKRYSIELEFQNTLKEKLINATTFEEITKEALSVVLNNIQNCVHIALLTLDEKKQNLSGYYLKGGDIFKERFNVKDTKSYDIIKTGSYFIENNLARIENNSASDKEAIELGVLSYIILPIISFDELLGTLNIGFDCEFCLTSNEIKNLQTFTTLLSTALNQLHLRDSLFDKNKDHVSSLMYAKNIQNTILPQAEGFSFPLEDVNVFFKPRDIVSGDFYWSKAIGDYTFIAVADCTGHGVPGAFLTLIGSRILEQIIISEKVISPAEILTKLDDQLYASLNRSGDSLVRDGMEIALCAIRTKTNLLTFAGAGMGLLYFSNNQNIYIKGQRKAIGDYRQEDFSFENHEIVLAGDELFFMATDGYQDQLGGENYKRYSKNRMVELLDRIKDMDAAKRNIEMANELALHVKQYNQTDDITAIGFRIKNK
jgi:PAS domain S-box-containing protein